MAREVAQMFPDLLKFASEIIAQLDEHESLRYALPVAAALAAAAWAYRVNIRNKRFDVILNCNNRYDILYQDRILIPKNLSKENPKVKQYYRRYWGLKGDQLDYWLSGGVDPQTFSNWFHSTLKAFSNGSSVGKLSYIDAWMAERQNQETINKSLVKFVDAILDIATKSINDNQKNQEHNAQMHYVELLFQMHKVESGETAFNKYMFDAVPRMVRGRLTVRSLVRTLPHTLQSRYWELEIEALRTRKFPGWIMATWLQARWKFSMGLAIALEHWGFKPV